MIVLPPNIERIVAQNSLIKRLYTTAIGYYPHAAFHDIERKSGSSQYILLYCTVGRGTVTVQGKTVNLTSNHYIILPRNIPHKYSSSHDDPWSMYWIHFTGESADTLYNTYLELGNEPVFLAFYEQRIAKFDLIFNLLEDSFERRNLEIANITLMEFISNFVYPQESYPTTIGSDKISDSISFMKKHINGQ